MDNLLTAKGKPVRAMVRTTSEQAKVDGLKGLGTTIVYGNLKDRSSLNEACQGVTAVISTASAMPFSYQLGENDIQTVDQEGVTNLITAAQSTN